MSPRLEELTYLYEMLTAEERDKLLQCLLIAAPRGGEAVVKVLEDTLLCHATEELLEANTTSLVAGADGCPAGWFVVMRDLKTGETAHHTVAGFTGLLDLCAWTKVLAVDIPVGLLETVSEGGRPVDRLARKRLQPHRASSVFPAPCRPATLCATYQEAVDATRAHSAGRRSLSRQAFGLFPKLREVDALMTPELQDRVREVHPELCFAALNDGHALPEYKKTPEGHATRIRLLQAAGFDISEAGIEKLAKQGVGKDDVLDAYAACWTAARIARGEAECLGDALATDGHGLLMQMWF